MRTQDKNKKRAKRKGKKIRLWKQTAAFFLSFFFVIGMVTVDESYSDMMGKESTLSLSTRRMDENTLQFGWFGQGVTLHTKGITDGMNTVRDQVAQGLEDITEPIREALSPLIEQERPTKENLPFEGKTL